MFNFIILDKEYTYRDDQGCDELAYYASFAEAKSHCNTDNECIGIVDSSCDGHGFNTCKGPVEYSSYKCSWLKGK